MGRKVNPIGFRLEINKTWEGRWYAEGEEYVTICTRILPCVSWSAMKRQRQVSRVWILSDFQVKLR